MAAARWPQFPMTIYPVEAVKALTFVVPITFVNWYPSLFILGKDDPLGLPQVVQFAAPAAAFALGLLAAAVWRLGLRRYDLLDLGSLLDTPVRQLSLGQRMRGDIAAALLHDPEIIYLDEPTIGLDVVSKSRLRDFLSETNRERGVTILLTTHDLVDIERLCARVMVIDYGNLVFDGPQEALHEFAGARRTLVVDLSQAAAAVDVAGADTVKVDGPRQWLTFPADASAAPIIADLTARHSIADLSILEPNIEDVITRIYARGTLDS